MPSDPIYDVFLSHAGPDKPAVQKLARKLRQAGLEPFLDVWHLVPGEPWQEGLEEALEQSRICAVFLGPGEIGPWQNEEMRDALDTRTRKPSYRVIPVLLPGAAMPEERDLPRFLKRLTWVDFRHGLDDPGAFHRLCCGIRGVPPGDGPEGHEPVAAAASTTFIAVPHRNKFFTGRDDLLAQLHEELQKEGSAALAQAAVRGLGGIGKTQTAVEYAYRFGHAYRHVLWVAAESEVGIGESYSRIARRLALPVEGVDLETVVDAVKAWLAREDDWLMIFDNADVPSLIRGYLPVRRKGGRVLLTSRARTFTDVGIDEPFRVQTMERADAVKFLLERTKRDEPENAAELAEELGYLPLALEQAAAYVDVVGVTLADYLTSYKRRGLQLLEKGQPGADYRASVATTWRVSIEAVAEESPSSVELLSAAAFLAPDSIPIEIFSQGAAELSGKLATALEGADEDPLVFREILAPLERYSLVERLPDDAFKLHRLTQEVVRDALGEDRRAWAERVVAALDAAYPEPPEITNWPLCERLQSHAVLALDLSNEGPLENASTARLMNKSGYYAQLRGDLATSLKLIRKSIELHERVLGPEHPDTLTSKDNLAETLRALGDAVEAKTLQEETLEISARVLGPEHPDTLTSKSNLAGTLWALGDLAGARTLQEETLEIRKRVLGPEHPDTLTSKNNLAETLRALGDAARARKLQEETLEISARVLGPEHPNTLTSKGNLALTLGTLGDTAGARTLLAETLEIRERVLGPEHPYTLSSKNNLAETFRALGDAAGARTLHEENLKIYERVLGLEHPDTLTSKNNLALTLRALGDPDGARTLHEKTLEIRERVLGPEHPDTTISTWNLLTTVKALDDPNAVAELIEKLRWLVERDEDSIASADQRTIRRRLIDLLDSDS